MINEFFFCSARDFLFSKFPQNEKVVDVECVPAAYFLNLYIVSFEGCSECSECDIFFPTERFVGNWETV